MLIFHSLTIPSFSPHSALRRRQPSEIIVSLFGDALLNVSDTLQFNSAIFQETVKLPNDFAVHYPSTVLTPTAQILLSDTPSVTLCSTLNLTLIPSLVEASRGFRSVVWSVVQPSSGTDVTELQSTLSMSVNQTVVSISPRALLKKVAYQIQAVFTSFIGTPGQISVTFTPTGCLEVVCSFSDDLKSLVLSFTNDDFTLLDSMRNVNTQPTSDMCSYIFPQSMVQQFGTSALCQ